MVCTFCSLLRSATTNIAFPGQVLRACQTYAILWSWFLWAMLLNSRSKKKGQEVMTKKKQARKHQATGIKEQTLLLQGVAGL